MKIKLQINGENLSVTEYEHQAEMYDSEYEIIIDNIDMPNIGILEDFLERVIDSNKEIFNYNIKRLDIDEETLPPTDEDLGDFSGATEGDR